MFASRRLALAAVGMTSVAALGSLGGLVLGNYTVAGTAIPTYRSVEAVASAPMPEPDLSERAATGIFGDSRATYRPASYVPGADMDGAGALDR
ncbi:hypothetical protein [Sphingomonas rustica]